MAAPVPLREPFAARSWALGLFLGLSAAPLAGGETIRLTGEVLDDQSRAPLPSRVYIRGEDGHWHFPESTSPAGSALLYQKRNWVNTNAVEMHTTLSAHPFQINLPAGTYTVTVERGKEYAPQTRQVQLVRDPVHEAFLLHRWINMARRGWFSGDTHVHRSLEELPNLVLSEDLNVSFPLLYWVTRAFTPPATGDKSASGVVPAGLVRVDDTHLIYPRNTEYEIFTVNGQSHTLGAVFVLRHQTVFDQGAPPVAAIAERAHREGALLDLDKHDWPWAMALVPIMGVDLFELSNNHIWRTEFGLTNWSTPAPAYMGLPNHGKNGTELDWLHYGLKNYYALLNCGFRLRPTAGTANGVHPVPLGFGRVYVQLGKQLDLDAWVNGLNEGRSFVTTGPMLLVTVDNEQPGHVFRQKPGPRTYRVAGAALYHAPLDRIEIIVNGETAATLEPRNRPTDAGAFESEFSEKLRLEESAWLAVRCFDKAAAGKARFAHTGPFHVEVAGKPLRPRREEVAFLIQRVEDQVRRSRGVLPEAALAEYERALAVYREIAARAR